MNRWIVAVVCVLLAGPAAAQTVTNPSAVDFTASADHSRVLTDGTAVLTGYQLDVMIASPTGAVAFTKGIGKPTPDGNGLISVPVPEFIKLSNGSYTATVSAVGPGGSSPSPASAPFNRVGPPSAPGRPTVR